MLGRGKLLQLKLRIQGEEIPSVVDKPIKYLGKWFDKSSGDTINVKEVVEQTRLRSKKTNKSGLPGKSKAWIYQHRLLPRVLKETDAL